MSTRFKAVQVNPSEQKDKQFLAGLWDEENEEMQNAALISDGLFFSGGAPFDLLFHREVRNGTFSIRRFCRLLEEETGRPYDVVCISAVTQTFFFYPADDWSEELLADFVNRYSNKGSEWIVTEEGSGNSLDVYCTGKTEEEIRLELLDASGAMYVSDIELIPYDGYRIEKSA